MTNIFGKGFTRACANYLSWKITFNTNDFKSMTEIPRLNIIASMFVFYFDQSVEPCAYIPCLYPPTNAAYFNKEFLNVFNLFSSNNYKF